MRLHWKRDALSCIFAERFVPRGGRGGLVACVALLLILFGACSPEVDPLRRASALAQEGEIDEALALLRKAVEAEPSNPGINHAFGIMLLRNGQAGLAVWPLRRAAEDPARRHDASIHLATALLSSQNGHEAIRVINEVLEAQPERFDALRLRANAYLSIRSSLLISNPISFALLLTPPLPLCLFWRPPVPPPPPKARHVRRER